MATPRSVRDQVKNALDYLVASDLALYANEVSMSQRRVSWHSPSASSQLIARFEHPTVEQYIDWVSAGDYSAVLFDGSLLQLTYDVAGGGVVGHRLCYFPCPFEVDPELLASNEAIADVIEIYRHDDAQLRSPVRFDYDPKSARSGHPSAHLTLNSVDCRIACVAPLHTMRFLDFIFRNFYNDLWTAHKQFFEVGRWKHIGDSVLANEDRYNGHVGWDVHATESSVLAAP